MTSEFNEAEIAAAVVASPIDEILLASAVAYEEPQPIPEWSPEGTLEELRELTGKPSHEYYPHRFTPEKDITPQSEPITDFLDRYIPDWTELDPHELGREVLFLTDKFDFEVSYEDNGNISVSWVDYSFGGAPTFEPSPAIELPDHRWLWPSNGSSIYNTVRYYEAGTAAFSSPTEFSTPAGEVSFSKMAHNEQAFEILIDTAHAWQNQANAIRETADDIRIAQRAQFAANTAFQAAKVIRTSKAEIVAAYLPDHMVGLSVYQIYPDKTALLNLVTVAPYLQPGNPEANIRGIGTGMICKVSQDLIENQVTQVCLKPLDDEAEKFWLNRGFEPQGREKLCVINGLEKLLQACEGRPDCPDQGDHCTIGNERQMARFTPPSVAEALYSDRYTS